MTNYNNGKYFGDSSDCLQYLEMFSSRNVKLYHILWSIPVNKFMAIKEIIFSVCQCCWYCLKMNTITNGNILRWKMEKVEQHDGGCCKGGSKQHSTQETLDGEQVPLHDDDVRIMMKMLQGKLQTTSNLANFTSICRAWLLARYLGRRKRWWGRPGQAATLEVP